jgi:hypothetical protein
VLHPSLSSLFDCLTNNWQGTEATKIITQFDGLTKNWQGTEATKIITQFDCLSNNWQRTEATKIIKQFSAIEISSAFVESFSVFERKISKVRPLAVCLSVRTS